MTKEERTKLIRKIAKILVKDWFKTGDTESVMELLMGNHVPLSRFTNKELEGYFEIDINRGG